MYVCPIFGIGMPTAVSTSGTLQNQPTNKQEKKAESKYQQVVLVMFGVGLSGDPTKAVGKWQSGTGSRYTHEP